ncbi:glycosyltransferase, partial [Spirulina sp. CS-785/01]|uniref:glycosyltransferase n=1 Tax=Spirulina sp. CS-785/01 TaxID=3021716 RepID=UPI00232DEFB4
SIPQQPDPSQTPPLSQTEPISSPTELPDPWDTIQPEPVFIQDSPQLRRFGHLYLDSPNWYSIPFDPPFDPQNKIIVTPLGSHQNQQVFQLQKITPEGFEVRCHPELVGQTLLWVAYGLPDKSVVVLGDDPLVQEVKLLHLDATQHHQTSPLRQELKAGQYEVKVLGTQQGGKYDAWSPWGFADQCDKNGENCLTGWLNEYYITASQLEVQVETTGIFATPQLALKKAQNTTFQLEKEEVVNFFIPKQNNHKNRGGLSLAVFRVLAPIHQQMGLLEDVPINELEKSPYWVQFPQPFAASQEVFVFPVVNSESPVQPVVMVDNITPVGFELSLVNFSDLPDHYSIAWVAYSFTSPQTAVLQTPPPASIHGEQLQIINLNASINNQNNPIQKSLKAGEYKVKVVNGEQGGLYEGWSHWNSHPEDSKNQEKKANGWFNDYCITSSEFSTKISSNRVYSSPDFALANAPTTHFTLNQDNQVQFFIEDQQLTPQSVNPNQGGISLAIIPIQKQLVQQIGVLNNLTLEPDQLLTYRVHFYQPYHGNYPIIVYPFLLGNDLDNNLELRIENINPSSFELFCVSHSPQRTIQVGWVAYGFLTSQFEESMGDASISDSFLVLRNSCNGLYQTGMIHLEKAEFWHSVKFSKGFPYTGQVMVFPMTNSPTIKLNNINNWGFEFYNLSTSSKLNGKSSRSLSQHLPWIAYCLHPHPKNLIHISAKQNNQDNPIVRVLPAGKYTVRLVGEAEGGKYNAWSRWNFIYECDEQGENCTTGWLNSYSIFSDEFSHCIPTTGVYAEDTLALSYAQTATFTLTAERPVYFCIEDDYLPDNQGGITLELQSLTHVPAQQVGMINPLIASHSTQTWHQVVFPVSFPTDAKVMVIPRIQNWETVTQPLPELKLQNITSTGFEISLDWGEEKMAALEGVTVAWLACVCNGQYPHIMALESSEDIPQGEAIVLHIEAQTHQPDNPLTQTFTAGTYEVEVINTKWGGKYDAWTPWGVVYGGDEQGEHCQVGWLNGYQIKAAEFEMALPSTGVYGSPELAAATARGTRFTLKREGEVQFFVDAEGAECDGGLSLAVRREGSCAVQQWGLVEHLTASGDSWHSVQFPRGFESYQPVFVVPVVQRGGTNVQIRVQNVTAWGFEMQWVGEPWERVSVGWLAYGWAVWSTEGTGEESGLGEGMLEVSEGMQGWDLSPSLPSQRIVMATYGSFGDLHPYMALALELQARGHHPIIAHAEPFRSKVEAAGIEFFALRPDTSHPLQGNGSWNEVLGQQQRESEYIICYTILPHLRATYEDLIGLLGEADLLLTHPFSFAGSVAAQMTNTPWVSTVLSPQSFQSAYDLEVDALQSLSEYDRALKWVARDSYLRSQEWYAKYWSAPVRELRRELGLPARLDPLFEGQHSPDLVLALFSSLLATPQPDWPKQTYATGFPFYDGQETLSPELQAFLEAGPPPIVFTLGSYFVWTPGNFYQEAAKAAQQLGYRAVLLMGKGVEAVSEVGENAIAVNYAPHSQLFPQAAAVVHHGGIGTTGQALRAGCPMLIVPFAYDQPDNARRVVQLGVGRTIRRSEYSETRLGVELQELLSNPSYRTHAQTVAQQIQQEDGIQNACTMLEAYLRFQARLTR